VVRKTTLKITCDSCGTNIKENDEWGLTIDHYDPDGIGYLYWRAELCPKCKEEILTILAEHISLRYFED